MKKLVELENRPDPAPTSSRKSENRNRALSKPDNENFQLNPPRLIISYMLEHYRKISARDAIDGSPEGVSTKPYSQKRILIRKGWGAAFLFLLKLSCNTLRGIRHDARCNSSPSSESRVFQCFAWMEVSGDDRSQVCAATAVAPFYLWRCNIFNFCFE
ncbi:MAG: hypothetical protein WCY70_04505 [Methanoculleus sp.]